MNDRELLERAAKAAGIVEFVRDTYGSHPARRTDGGGLVAWNPLTDDGDALRLAVKLGIDVGHGGGIVTAVRLKPTQTAIGEEYSNDPYAATRRAIVRAAAAMAE